MKTKRNDLTTIKYFRIESGIMHASDPCYQIDVNNKCGVYNIKAHTGVWKATVEYSDDGMWGIRPVRLNIRCLEKDFHPLKIENYNICVDSGQFGFFDEMIYPNGEDELDYGNPKSIYRLISNLTCDPNERGINDNWGIIGGMGVVSESYMGDGSYPLTLFFTDGSLTSAFVDFDPKGDEEDEDSEYDEDNFNIKIKYDDVVESDETWDANRPYSNQ